MIVTLQQLFAFLTAAILITLSPGPDNLMVLSLGMAKGRRQGMVFGLGCALGCITHTMLAALGVSALIAASPVAFNVLKFIGGAYLIWMGIQALRSRGSALRSDAGQVDEALPRLFAKGLFANAINPKVVLFFLSFLPQFVVTANGHVGAQTAILGASFTLQAAILFGSLGYFAGHIGGWFSRTPRAGQWLDRLAGCVFVGLGARLLLVRS